MGKLRTIQPTAEVKIKNRYAAYCRVSSDSDDQLNSYAAQITYYTEYAKTHENINFIGIYADEGLTGTKTDKRDEFLRMIQDCRDGKIDRVMVKSISRFARNTVDCLNALRELKTLGVTVFFEKEALDTANEDTEIMLTAMGCFAQEESLSISKNMKLGVRMKMKNGTYLMSRPPYGYTIQNRELVIKHDEAEVVKLIYQSYLNGMGRFAIASMLNERGIMRNEDGGKWRDSTVRYILTNEKYIGDELLQKSYTTEDLPFQKKYNHGEFDKYYYSDTHEAIIDRETFNQVKRRINNNNRFRSICETNSENNIYRSLIICENCGSRYRIKRTSEGDYFTCRRHDKNKNDCPSLRISKAELDSVCVRMLNKLIKNRNVIIAPALKLMLALKIRVTTNHSELVRIDRELTELNEQLAVVTKLKDRDLMDLESYNEQMNDMMNRINSLRSKRRLFLNKTDGDECITELKRLLSTLESAKELTEPDGILLRKAVTRIGISESDIIHFHLLGGITITEHIRRI